MKLFVFVGEETEWVAASSIDEACATLKLHYGINDSDIAGSYEEISEIDPSDVLFDTDAVDAETEETIMTTAAEIMAKMTGPGLVGSTYQ